MSINTKWNKATLVERKQLSSHMWKLLFKVNNFIHHIPGQFVDIKLVAPDGYSAERSYSIANAVDSSDIVELGIELIENGEVSPYLVSMDIGEVVLMRGPLGGHFIWQGHLNNPLILVGGGSGLVPLISMLREHRRKLEKNKIFVLASSQNYDRLPYRDELFDMRVNEKILISLTRDAPSGWNGIRQRFDADILDTYLGSVVKQSAEVFVCGSNSFVETLSRDLVSVGVPMQSIKVERFG